MLIEQFEDGVAICADSTETDVFQFAVQHAGGLFPLIIADPPYGNIVADGWDRTDDDQEQFAARMFDWSIELAKVAEPGGALYVWGGYGQPGFRPFFEYAARVERETEWRIANYITWGKKRAYGVQHNYLSTREELLYLVKGDIKKPRLFNVPYLEEKRGYAGYNEKYPAKSEHFRRTSVWTDITEIMRGKVHVAQKPLRVLEIPIEVHTVEGEWVLDPFAGSMSTAWAARKLGRKWICIERNLKIFESAVTNLRAGERKR